VKPTRKRAFIWYGWTDQVPRTWQVLLTFLPMTDCLFCKIIAGKIPTKKIYEDEKAFAFEDINPQAPTHVLIIPKKHIAGIDQASETDAELIGYCQLVAAKIARERKLEHGFRTVYNVGPHAGQTVFHLHLHLLGGRQMTWPPG
jgi:histidine triad (HIT) family protein